MPKLQPQCFTEPCIGYVFDEITSPRHKIVVLGDTYDPSPLIPLCEDPSPTLLIHEATDSTISPERDRNGKLSKRTIEVIMKTTLARGHSTPVMAGEFARRVDAQALVLNHIGSRYLDNPSCLVFLLILILLKYCLWNLLQIPGPVCD